MAGEGNTTAPVTDAPMETENTTQQQQVSFQASSLVTN